MRDRAATRTIVAATFFVAAFLAGRFSARPERQDRSLVRANAATVRALEERIAVCSAKLELERQLAPSMRSGWRAKAGHRFVWEEPLLKEKP